ncbi:PREDICTED: uncharacterized protein LOC104699114 [Camelina sativa]|uniref:Uncharacterized protein LOC104699114 n=1 Tax=Camelina sativa TaxID=90675 RepID=A0ABM0SL26_CAMSA|nr:PREDICTED: uncharacterized protein LOC104699114 [Camelina sativa]
MGDSNPPQRSKDLGSPSIQCPMLTSTNYTVWSMRMKITLRVSEVWDTIEPGSADVKMNDVAIALLFQSIPETLILQIGEQNSAKNLWEAIKSRHQGADRSVDEYVGKRSGLAAQSASLGEAIDDTKLVKKFLSEEEVLVEAEARPRCPDKPLQHHETNLNETQEAEALYVHEVVFLNEDKVFPDNYDTNTASVWYLDNGASNHMTGNKEFFSSLDENIKGRVKFGDGSYVNIIGKCSIVFVTKSGERRALKEIYYIPDLKHNIISLGQATENGCEVKMKGNKLTLSDSHEQLLVQVVRSPNRLYKTPLEISFQKCLSIQEEEATWTWHARLGHISVGVMNNMVRKDMVVGMPQVLREMNEKSEAFDRFKRFKEFVEKQTGKDIKTFRTDRGGEFTSTEFNRFCEENGVSRHLTAPYTPQQNGVIERRNRTLMEMTRSLLKAMKVPNDMWGEAVRDSTYLINRVPTKALQGQTPYESLWSKKPNIEHLRVFGCVAHVKITGPHLKKLDDRSRSVINLGT